MSFDNYYTDQASSNLPVFRGASFQRGYGFGNVFKKIFRWIVPIVKKHAQPIAKKVGKEALRTAANIANDTLGGKSLRESASNRIQETLTKILNGQFGNGHYKKKRKRKNSNILKLKKRKLDIFDKKI